MKTNKSTLYTILALLVIFLPIAAYGTYAHIHAENLKKLDNPNKEFYYNGALYFYDEAGILKSKYICETSECGYAKTIIDDEEYNIDYYKDGTNENVSNDQSNYVFIKDGEKVILYSILNERVIMMYDAIKDYHTKLENNYLIVKYNGKWGAISLDSYSNVLSFEYDFVGLPNRYIDNELQTDDFIVAKDDEWFITDTNKNTKSAMLNRPIVNYNADYIITSDKKIYDYQGNSISALEYKDVYIAGEYIILVTNSNMVIVYENLNSNQIGYATVGTYTTLSFEVEDNLINVYADGTMATTIDLP